MKKYILWVAVFLAVLFVVAAVYYKMFSLPGTQNDVASHDSSYYNDFAKGCGENSCCLSSVDRMRTGNFILAANNGTCPHGLYSNMYKCKGSLTWCEPGMLPPTVDKENKEADSYLACGCGCCGNTPIDQCLYHSKGDDLEKIKTDDEISRKKADCAVAGCSAGVRYHYCD